MRVIQGRGEKGEKRRKRNVESKFEEHHEH